MSEVSTLSVENAPDSGEGRVPPARRGGVVRRAGGVIFRSLLAYVSLMGINGTCALLVGLLWYGSWDALRIDARVTSFSAPAIVAGLWGACLGNVSIVGVLLLRSRWRRERPAHRLGIASPPRRAFVMALFLVPLAGHGGQWLFQTILQGLGFHPRPQLLAKLLGETPIDAAFALAALYICLLGPLLEEVIFRGFLYTGLRRRFGVLPALLASSVVFGYTHVLDPDAVVPIILLGVVLGVLYERSANLWVPVAGHVANNTLALLWLLLSRVA
ncbi:MAG: CPBP family intramembrane metalloprotease [Deltaproteobacteria bacterium]|nr:MAG: CPBP family intramembrane metalloprotease [Deltaproteobacteria bacterium]